MNGITKKEKNKLRIKLQKEKNYSFEWYGFWLPKFISSNLSCYTSKVLIDLEKNIRKNLNNRSHGEEKFGRQLITTIKRCYDNTEDIFKVAFQFPILIDNPSLWEDCKLRCGLNRWMKDLDGRCYWDRQYFVLDFLLPYSQIAIEIDYEVTHPCPEYDKARDLYILKRYGIKTIRYVNYGIKKETSLEISRSARQLLEKISNSPPPKLPNDYLDYGNFILKRFIQSYRIEFDVLEIIRNEVGWDEKEITIPSTYILSKYYRKAKHQFIRKRDVSVSKLRELMEFIGLKLIIV